MKQSPSRPGTSRWDLDRSDANIGHYRVEGSGGLAVAVADQEPEPLSCLLEVGGEVAVPLVTHGP
ncbi:MAG: hypothetical protein ACYDAQ_10485, partial [Mycobacteriales bacterium]